MRNYVQLKWLENNIGPFSDRANVFTIPIKRLGLVRDFF